MGANSQHLTDLHEKQLTLFRERAIRGAFLYAASGLPGGRPKAVRAIFDNAARRYSPTRVWGSQQSALRELAKAAAANGHPVIIATVRQRIEAYYDTCRADALAPLPLMDDEVSVIEAALHETRQQGPADVAEGEFLLKPQCRERLARYVESARAHMKSLADVVARGERQLFGGVALWR